MTEETELIASVVVVLFLGVVLGTYLGLIIARYLNATGVVW